MKWGLAPERPISAVLQASNGKIIKFSLDVGVVSGTSEVVGASGDASVGGAAVAMLLS